MAQVASVEPSSTKTIPSPIRRVARIHDRIDSMHASDSRFFRKATNQSHRKAFETHVAGDESLLQAIWLRVLRRSKKNGLLT